MKIKEKNNYTLGAGCRMYGQVKIGTNTVIGDYVILGYPKESRIAEQQSNKKLSPALLRNVNPTIIGSVCKLDSHIIVHEGTHIGDRVFIDDFCRIGYNCKIGDSTRIVYGAFVCDRVKIGQSCVVAGFICDGTVIEDSCTVMGQLVHEYSQPHTQWGVDEPSPVIEHHCSEWKGKKLREEFWDW